MDKYLIDKFKNNILNNIKLSSYSWFNLGGPAEYFFKPKNKDQIIEFLKDILKKIEFFKNFHFRQIFGLRRATFILSFTSATSYRLI